MLSGLPSRKTQGGKGDGPGSGKSAGGKRRRGGKDDSDEDDEDEDENGGSRQKARIVKLKEKGPSMNAGALADMIAAEASGGKARSSEVTRKLRNFFPNKQSVRCTENAAIFENLTI